ncbi:NHL repeat-containing protein [Nocardia heshunensis]
MPRRRPEAAVPQSDRRGRITGVIALLLGSAAFAVPAAAAPETPGAPAVSCSPAKFLMGLPSRTPLLDWSENLGFDASGALWVARNFGNVVEKYDNDNRGQVVTSVPVTSPGAVRLGPDGLLYVTFGNSPISGAARQGGVLRFDPNAAVPQPEVFVSGLGQANGAAFDSDGNLYVADSVSNTVERIRRDGTLDTEWTERAGKALSALGSGADGIVAVGDVLYVTLLESPTARIVTVPIADPAQASVAVDLAAAPLTPPLLPDDMAVGPGGFLYVATGSGQLVRADPVSHTSCTLASIEPLTSVAVSPNDNRLLLLGTENGDVLKAHVPPA